MPLAAPIRMPLSLPVNCRSSGPKPRSEMQPLSTRLTAMPAASCFFILPPVRCCPLQSPLSPDLARDFHHAFELSARVVGRQRLVAAADAGKAALRPDAQPVEGSVLRRCFDFSFQ